MTSLIAPGPVRLAVLNGVNGTKLKTLYLPMPDRRSPEFEWAHKRIEQELVDGGERTRVLGDIPVLKVKWTPYDDRAVFGYTIGTNDGQKPSLEQLLGILDATPGTLKVSLGGGTSPLGFVVGRVTIDKMPFRSNGFVDLVVTFRGRDVVTGKTLGAF